MSNNNVEIPKSHYKEWQSKRNFEELIEPWYMPFNWAVRDYGIDGQVEITRPINDSDSFRPDSKFFFVQLKSTDDVKIIKDSVSFSIPVKKIIQWYSSNLPVMLALNDFSTQKFYMLWIDITLINKLDSTNENWVNQKSITLKIPVTNVLTKESLENIRQYVLSWKTTSRKIIQPGIYFELKDRCKELLKLYSTISTPFNFESISNDIDSFNIQIEQAIYKIAITGQSRVGKSSLINALLKRKDVSPTGFFQTTGVPIQVLPNKEDLVKIIYRNGKIITEKFSFNVIEEHASQDKNEDNKKAVAIVAIHLANRQLERGVSFFDIPGFNDPNEDIYNYAWNTATKANAIIYVIDASSAEHGGFIFSSEYKKHLLGLGQSLDKIFLVFNKINALSNDKLELLKERIIKDLKKYDLYSKVSEKIYYLSAEESLNVRLQKSKGTDTVQKLEDDIWNYLLNENKYGLANLISINQDIYKSSSDFVSLLNTRLVDNEKRIILEKALLVVKNKLPELKNIYTVKENEIRKSIFQSLTIRKNNILTTLENYLRKISIDKELPNTGHIKNYLSQGGHKTLEDTNLEYAHQVNILKELIDNWVEDNLKQVREIVQSNSEQKIVDFSGIENLEMPSIDLSSSFGVGFIAGVVGFVINPGAAVAAAFAAFFSNLILSAEDRRAKRISKVIQESKKRYDELFQKIEEGYNELITEHSAIISKYANNKINSYFKDINCQINKLDNPITDSEMKLYDTAFRNIENLNKETIKTSEELKSWYSSL
ncbi:DUF4365 domain-containing protein [Cytophaga hutchinsonii]|uniref:Uncharacterized protein n=1 Tax=Cytophaga hutchinsonii (strain ATCC 33406 / DSM 1761 / CIP 103989 / NBRC 15051 / NCIMB 9469 / D465) TaxID=269798 RepID=A0A6N4SUL6_CYTH3|nr:DUF4365 domain-containing protein [Cytophaga hutchinsonii]ABG60200.1 conserved hypothetical protein; possible GTPase [Cytophaga hutchinsonii ATCC 33406]SFX22092.1 GTP-binding protein EngB required for normal cell division [Cytophaga hutchinsonii ATCC 33406]